jgi:hypothetical protein
MAESRMVELLEDISANEQEYLAPNIPGCDMHEGSVVKFVRVDGDKVLCDHGSGKYYLPKSKVSIF